MTVQRVPDLRQQVFDQLRASINGGEIAADERLTEMTIAKRFSVSRTPAREALALLSQAGLLVQDERGYRVPSFSRTDIDNVFEVRGLIEPYAVACISRDSTDVELKALAKFCAAEFKRSADNAEYADANKKIRNRLFALLRNDKMLTFVQSFDDRLAFIRVQTLRDPATRKISADGNEKLIAAVTARDAAAAEECMRYLLAEAHKALVARI